MSHTIRGKKKLLARVRRVRGQAEAIERALDGEAGCELVMHLIAGARGIRENKKTRRGAGGSFGVESGEI